MNAEQAADAAHDVIRKMQGAIGSLTQGAGGGSQPPVDDGKRGAEDGGMSNERIATLEAIIPTLATKGDLEVLRADLHKMDAGISRWMLGTVITIIGTMVVGIGGLTYTVANGQRAAPAAAPTPNIIINVPSSAAPQASTASR